MKKNFSAAIRETCKILDVWLPSKIHYDETPGLAVGIVHKGKLVYEKGFGHSDIASEKPVTTRTSFRIASISKTFTAIAVFQLVAQKKVRLTDPVGKFLPWLSEKNPAAAKVQVRELLSHTGALLRDGDTPHWEDGNFPDQERLKATAENIDPIARKRGKFKYSNLGFALLGLMIENVSGEPYEDFVSKNLLRPLGLRHTFPDLCIEATASLATGYGRIVPDVEREIVKNVPAKVYAPAAGFISDLCDLSTYLEELSAPRKNGPVPQDFQRSAVKRAVSFQRPGEKGAYGFGFNIWKVAGQKLVGHGGATNGYMTRIAMDLKNDIGVIALSNANTDTARAVAFGIFETIYKVASLKTKEKRIHGNIQGVYRSRWTDLAVADTNVGVFVFNPRQNSPLKDFARLVPRKENTFTIDTEDGFSCDGELATFRPEGMHFGPMPYKKIG